MYYLIWSVNIYFSKIFIFLGIILEYELKDKSKEMKEIDLLHLTAELVTLLVLYTIYLINFDLFPNSADVDVIVNQIVFEEPLITENKKPHLRRMIYSKTRIFYSVMLCVCIYTNNIWL